MVESWPASSPEVPVMKQDAQGVAVLRISFSISGRSMAKARSDEATTLSVWPRLTESTNKRSSWWPRAFVTMDLRMLAGLRTREVSQLAIWKANVLRRSLEGGTLTSTGDWTSCRNFDRMSSDAGPWAPCANSAIPLGERGSDSFVLR